MKLQSTHGGRRSIRLRDYDYSQEGAYFVTLCTQDKICFFGTVDNGEMLVNDAGSMVDRAWSSLPETCPGIELDEFKTMPNHLHGIVVLSGEPVLSGPGPVAGPPLILGEVVKRFKTWTLNRYIDGVKKANWPRFPGRLWQRNYYERVIRDERELERIRHYIHYNPLGWEDDDYHPSKKERRVGRSSDPLRFDSSGDGRRGR